MRKTLKILIFLAKAAIAPLIILACAEFGLRYIIHSRMLDYFQQTLEKEFKGDIQFLDVDIVTISNFPIATLTIDSINLKNANYELFSAAKVKAYIDLNKLYKKARALEKIDLTGVQLYLPMDSTGRLLTIQSTGKSDDTSKGNLEMAIPEIHVSDLAIVFENEQEGHLIQMALDSGVFDLTSTKDLLEINGDAFMTVNTRMNSLSYDKHNPKLQLQAKIRNAEPADSISAPHIQVDFAIKEAIYNPSGKYNKVDSINLIGYYSNGRARNSSSRKVVIEYGKINYDDSYFNFSGHIENFDDPFISLDLNSSFHLDDLSDVISLDNAEMTGNVKLRAVINDHLATLDHGLESAGEISDATFSFDDVNIDHQASNMSIQDLSGQFSLKEAKLAISRLEGKYNGMALSVKGNMDNFLPLLGFKNGQYSKASLDIYTERLEIPKLNNSDKSSDDSPIVPEFLELDLSFKADEVLNDSIELTNMNLSLFARDDSINLDLKSNEVIYNVLKVLDVDLKLSSKSKSFDIELQADQLDYDSLNISDLSLSLFANDDSINMRKANFKFEKGDIELHGTSDLKPDSSRFYQVWVSADLPFIDINKYLPKANEKDTTNDESASPISLELISDIKVGKLKYNNVLLDKVHLKSEYNDSSFNASVLGFDFPFGHIQSSLEIDWSDDTTYTINGLSTARLKRFNIDSIKYYFNNLNFNQSEPQSSSDTSRSLLVERYTMNFAAPGAVYDIYDLQDLSATLTIRDNDIKIHRAKFDMLDGTFGLNGAVRFDEQKHIHIDCNLRADELSLGDIIGQFGPEEEGLFGKEHFSGKLGLNGSFILKYNDELDHQESDMIGLINISLSDGEVVNFSPISESLKFIKHENREVIYLANPEFMVLFHNDELVIPTTIFKTSLTNIELSGHHGDGENFRYDVMISMNDLFFRSKEKIKSEIQAEENDSTAVGSLKHHISVQNIDEEMKVSFLSKKRYEEQLSSLRVRHQLVDSLLQTRKLKSK